MQSPTTFMAYSIAPHWLEKVSCKYCFTLMLLELKIWGSRDIVTNTHLQLLFCFITNGYIAFLKINLYPSSSFDLDLPINVHVSLPIISFIYHIFFNTLFVCFVQHLIFVISLQIYKCYIEKTCVMFPKRKCLMFILELFLLT